MRQKIRRFTTLITLLSFPVVLNYFSPYLPVHGAVQGIITGSLIFFLFLFAISLVLGRAFCGWVCPGAGLQDTLAKIREKPVKKGNSIKFLIWVPWISAIIILLAVSGKAPTVQPLYFMKSFVSVDRPIQYITYYSVITLIIMPGLIAGKRSFCHHICWMAPWMMVGGKIRDLVKIPSLGLSVESSACTSCGRCDRACPMCLDVQKMALAGSMRNGECVLCGECADTCPKKVIRYGFGRPI